MKNQLIFASCLFRSQNNKNITQLDPRNEIEERKRKRLTNAQTGQPFLYHFHFFDFFF